MDQMDVFRKYSIEDLRTMLTYKQRQYTDITFRRRFGVLFSKKDLQDALEARQIEVALLGDEDTSNKVNIVEPECNCDVNYGNSFGT